MESFNSQAAYQALCDNTANILEAKLDLHSIADKLISLRIIGDTDKERITDRCSGQTTRDCTEHLLQILIANVKINGIVFGKFIEILREDKCSQREKDLAEKLMASYKGNYH